MAQSNKPKQEFLPYEPMDLTEGTEVTRLDAASEYTAMGNVSTLPAAQPTAEVRGTVPIDIPAGSRVCFTTGEPSGSVHSTVSVEQVIREICDCIPNRVDRASARIAIIGNDLAILPPNVLTVILQPACPRPEEPSSGGSTPPGSMAMDEVPIIVEQEEGQTRNFRRQSPFPSTPINYIPPSMPEESGRDRTPIKDTSQMAKVVGEGSATGNASLEVTPHKGLLDYGVTETLSASFEELMEDWTSSRADLKGLPDIAAEGDLGSSGAEYLTAVTPTLMDAPLGAASCSSAFAPAQAETCFNIPAKKGLVATIPSTVMKEAEAIAAKLMYWKPPCSTRPSALTENSPNCALNATRGAASPLADKDQCLSVVEPRQLHVMGFQVYDEEGEAHLDNKAGSKGDLSKTPGSVLDAGGDSSLHSEDVDMKSTASEMVEERAGEVDNTPRRSKRVRKASAKARENVQAL